MALILNFSGNCHSSKVHVTYRVYLWKEHDMKSWSDIGFEIERTGDGSPSLRLLTSVDPDKFRGESMHHSGGACAETLLIYGRPVKHILQVVNKPSFLIVGLGLGYIEMAISREALLLGLSSQKVGVITSYESVPELREFFYNWIWDHKEVLSREVCEVYDSAAEKIVQETSVTVAELKSFLQEKFQTLSDLQGALSDDAVFPTKYHGILYDAFSSKTTPFLWEQNFLEKVLATGAAEQCQFSTYACRVSLKKALADQGFDVVVREGFQGKRNSTLGLKGFS